MYIAPLRNQDADSYPVLDSDSGLRGAADKSAAQGICAFVYDGLKWARLFQQGRESCEDDPRPGRPVTVVTEENVRKMSTGRPKNKIMADS
ncbi:hypothetical protein EVAR_94581_1 [Eumeta japonica]|uniref:Uncharacterized protein n=1 Tax=Eumeta variegata TaxID=151549 RepID=A0A4C1UTE2_EUMVA|nr:hypothetical protein EVAR_94581_1 [Eumeta japonica]